MDLEGPADQNGRAATTALVATAKGWIPEAVPARLAGQELETLQSRAKLAVLLNQ